MKTTDTQGIQFMFRISGMTCGHCETRVSDIARSIPGVLSATSSVRKGTLSVRCEPDTRREDMLSLLEHSLADTGYRVSENAKKHHPDKDTIIALGAGLAIIALFYGADRSGLFTSIPVISGNPGLGALFIIGLLTSLHCISMCGGIALSQGIGRQGDTANTSIIRRMRPSFVYNAGRVTAYTGIGALLGATGSAFTLGQHGRVLIMVIAGIFMVLTGLSLSSLIRFPSLRLPFLQTMQSRIGQRAASMGPFAVGLANSLIPCGPLQAMQLFALGSGSALSGALALFAFSAGTAPLLFVFGTGGSFFPLRLRTIAMRAGAILVVFMGLVTLGRSRAFVGEDPSLYAQNAIQAAGQVPAADSDETTQVWQEVTVEVQSRAYGDIRVRKGTPVRVNLHVAPGRLNGCNNAIVIPALNLKKRLRTGDNYIEFMPSSPGTYSYYCWMGMIESTITVVDN